MNCKPGDLAIIKKAIHPENLGRIVRVVEPWPYLDAPAWVVEGGTRRVSYDCNLRPLDNPSDDAQDLLLAPLPQQDKTPA